MSRIWMSVGVTLGTAAVISAISSACAHNDASIFISQVFAPTTPTNGLCLYTPDPTQALISGGVLDVSFSTGAYAPVVLIGNQLVPQSNNNALQVETSHVIIHGAQTRITDLAGNPSILALLSNMCAGGSGDPAACATGKAVVAGVIPTPVNPFSTVETTQVPPGTGTQPGYGALALTIVDPATVEVLRAYFANAVTMSGAAALSTSIQLITYTKALGTTLGGDSEETNEFEFPVTITYGQLVSNLKPDTMSAVGYCLDTSVKVPTTQQACVYGQDQPAIVGAFPGIPNCTSADAGATTG